jgi:ABC-type sulfate transport system permease subunit
MMTAMSGMTFLLTAIGIVLAFSTVTIVAIHGPLRRQLRALCPVDTTAAFWMRSAVALIYLVPMSVVLGFGLPELTRLEFTAAEALRRTITTTTFTLALIVTGIALRLAMVGRPSKFDDYPRPVR